MDTGRIRGIAARLGTAYESIQGLGLQPTKTNMEILLGALDAMQTAYQYLMRTAGEAEAAGKAAEEAEAEDKAAEAPEAVEAGEGESDD